MKDKLILDRIIADQAIVAIIDNRIWTTWLPEKTIYPAITCNYVNDNPVNTMSGEDPLENEIININLWCEDKPTLNALYQLVKARMDGFAIRQNKIDLSDFEQGLHRFALTYSIWA